MRQVYGTQGGGLAREVEGHYVFVEVPKHGNYKVGDDVPLQWSLTGPFDWDDGLKQV